jgi:hypothetical protein
MDPKEVERKHPKENHEKKKKKKVKGQKVARLQTSFVRLMGEAGGKEVVLACRTSGWSCWSAFWCAIVRGTMGRIGCICHSRKLKKRKKQCRMPV